MLRRKEYHNDLLQNLTPTEQLRAGRSVRRFGQLFFGLSIFGFGNAGMLRSGWGMDPWNVFHQGLATIVPWTLGSIIIVVSLLVMLLWIPLRQKPGFGTIANAIWLGLATDMALRVVPPVTIWWHQALLSISSIVVCALAIALYIGAQLGPGPRDGLMTGLAARTGRSIRLVRTAIEITVFVAGLLLGGVFGPGTFIFAVTIGPLVQFFLPWVVVPVPPPVTAQTTPPTR